MFQWLPNRMETVLSAGFRNYAGVEVMLDTCLIQMLENANKHLL